MGYYVSMRNIRGMTWCLTGTSDPDVFPTSDSGCVTSTSTAPNSGTFLAHELAIITHLYTTRGGDSSLP
jgi:hypothetical protein